MKNSSAKQNIHVKLENFKLDNTDLNLNSTFKFDTTAIMRFSIEIIEKSAKLKA